MTEAYSKQAQQHAIAAPQASLLDSIFDTHLIINIAIIASGIGIIILLCLAYLLRNTTTVLHLGILASLMLILCAVLVVYKGMITANPYDPIQNQQRNTACLDDDDRNQTATSTDPKQENKESDSDGQSDDSSLYEVVPKISGHQLSKQTAESKQN